MALHEPARGTQGRNLSFSAPGARLFEGLWHLLQRPDWQQHPDKYKDYPLERFTEDFSTESDWKGPINSYHVDFSKRDDTGVVVASTINGKNNLTLKVQRSDGTIGILPIHPDARASDLLLLPAHRAGCFSAPAECDPASRLPRRPCPARSRHRGRAGRAVVARGLIRLRSKGPERRAERVLRLFDGLEVALPPGTR
jgi:hypothetical protein